MRLAVLFALTGFLIAIVAAICMSAQAPDAIVQATLFLSPAVWLFVERVWARIQLNHWVLAWWLSVGIVAVLNALFYGMVGAIITGLLRIRKQRGNSASP
jgi:hypothetical protein